jgi:hypothetical protein
MWDDEKMRKVYTMSGTAFPAKSPYSEPFSIVLGGYEK